MVRRRPRPKKSAVEDATGDYNANIARMAQEWESSAAAISVSKAKILEDQYFASPKRKDCKISNGQNNSSHSQRNGQVHENRSRKTIKTRKSPSPVGHQSESGGGYAERNIEAVPQAIRSQTRTIDAYFKARTASKHLSKISNATIEQIDLESAMNTKITANCNDHFRNNESNEEQYAIFPIIGQTSCEKLLEIEYDGGECASSSPPILHNQRNGGLSYKIQNEFIFDFNEETNDTDNTELSEGYSNASGEYCSTSHTTQSLPTQTTCTAPTVSIHCSIIHDKDKGADKTSSSSSCNGATENIFLQEPVLTLNVDKSPNQASSIKINKTLEIQPIFSSPPSISASLLNADLRNIVSLQCSQLKNYDSLFFDKQLFDKEQIVNNKELYVLSSSDNDNSSCDSGVAFTTSTTNTVRDASSPQSLTSAIDVIPVSRRRKPATPHRIVCPSPKKKTASITISSSYDNTSSDVASSSPHKISASSDGSLSPRKSAHGRSVTTCSKTRRRLNQQEVHEAPYYLTENVSEIVQNVYNQSTVQNVHRGTRTKKMTNFEDLQIIVDEKDAETITAAVSPKYELKSRQPETSQNLQQQQHKPKPTNRAHQKPTKAINNKQSQQTKVKAQPKPNQNQPLPANKTNNHELTEYFPVRRSVRKTKTAVKEEMMRNLEKAILEERADGLKIAYFENKGRGVVAERRFQRGEFVVEYIGDLISMTEATEREKEYALDENAGCYMYYFKHKNQQYCIDATVDTGKLGRLVNHSRNGNLLTKVVVVKQRPHLILTAKDDIEPGEELTYDYGDRSKESLLHHPWLAF